MPFKNARGHYFTQRVLPGYGELRRTSLRTKRKADAVALEDALLEVHRRGLHDPKLFQVLDAVQGEGKGQRGALSAQDVLVAVKAPDGPELGLQRLIRSLDDPPLRDVVAERLAAGDDVNRTDRIALPAVVASAEALFGPRCPVSVLRDAGRVTDVLKRVEADAEKLPNSVVRYEKRAISKLLTARYGRAERDRVVKDVAYSGGDDRRRLRESVVTQAAIGRLCAELKAGHWNAGDEAAPLYVRLACATGATVSPLSRTTVGQWNAGAGVIYLAGTKRSKRGKTARDRDVRVPPQLVPEVETFASLAATERPDDPSAPLFPLAYSRFGSMWKKAVKRAKLTEAVIDGRGDVVPLRPHDLRRVFALFARRAGVSREKVGLAGLGHDRLETTDRYVRSQTSIESTEAAAVAEALGF